MHLEHHLVGGYVRYISPHIIIITYNQGFIAKCVCYSAINTTLLHRSDDLLGLYLVFYCVHTWFLHDLD